MRHSIRWTLVFIAIAAVIVVAFVTQLGGPQQPPAGPTAVPDGAQLQPPADSDEALAAVRAQAGLAPCPAPDSDAAGPEPLRGLTVECAADGTDVDVGAALAGRPTVLNLWAYWCGPCADELPAMAEYQRRMGQAVTVLTVHQDPNEGAGLNRLAELGVELPTLQDGARSIAGALGVPNVMPATVVLRADGSVARILPRAFTDADEIEAAVGDDLR